MFMGKINTVLQHWFRSPPPIRRQIMTRNSIPGIDREHSVRGNVCPLIRLQLMNLAVLWCAVLMAVTGCETQTPPKGFIDSAVTNHSEAITLRGGDVLKI